MRTACKIVLNSGTRALSESMEAVLTSPIVRGHMMDEPMCDALLDRLSRIDLRAIDGQEGPEGFKPDVDWHDSLLAILTELVNAGVVDPEVWRLYRNPEAGAAASEHPEDSRGPEDKGEDWDRPHRGEGL